MILKCAWCNSGRLWPLSDPPAEWAVAFCPECENMNRFRPYETWDAKIGLVAKGVVSEMLPAPAPVSLPDDARAVFSYDREVTAVEIGRAINKIIRESDRDA